MKKDSYTLARELSLVCMGEPEKSKHIFDLFDKDPNKSIPFALASMGMLPEFGSTGFNIGFQFAMCLLHPGANDAVNDLVSRYISEVQKSNDDKTINFKAYLNKKKGL